MERTHATCPRCARVFPCASRTGHSSCWCVRAAGAAPSAGACLCPECLHAAPEGHGDGGPQRAATFGHGDPAIPADAMERHDRALAAGQPLYADPRTGLMVQTTAALAAAGACCGSACRHCPYPVWLQSEAGRPRRRPPPAAP